jgi:hypothetical protein
MATKLFCRHVVRGWDKSTMKQWILDADAKITSAPPSLPSPEQQPILTNKERLFVHLEYHRNDISKAKVRSLYEIHCREKFETILGIKQLTVAYSRSNNIRDMVTKAKLHQAPGQKRVNIIGGGSRKHDCSPQFPLAASPALRACACSERKFFDKNFLI